MPSRLAASAAQAQCIKGTFRGQTRYCGLYHCPQHGWFVRLRRALREIGAVPPERDYYTTVLHVNRRMTARQVGKLVGSLRRVILRTDRDVRCKVWVHVRGSTSDGLPPYPHLHVVASVPRETEAVDIVNTISRTVGREWLAGQLEDHIRIRRLANAAGRQGGAVQVGDHTRSPARPRVLPWQKVVDLKGTILYLYQATCGHNSLPPDQLPRRGDRYRQTHGKL